LFRTSHTMQQTQQEDSWYSGSRYQSWQKQILRG
jgi:hypothetical protein